MKNIRDISADVMCKILTDPNVSSYEMYEELEDLYASSLEHDREVISNVLMILTQYNFDEIKEMVEKRIKEEGVKE